MERVVISRRGNRLYLTPADQISNAERKSYGITYAENNPNNPCVTSVMYPERLDLTTRWITTRKVPTFFEALEMYLDIPEDFITKSWPDSERVFLAACETKQWSRVNKANEKYTQQKTDFAQRSAAVEEAAEENISAAAAAGAELEKALVDKLVKTPGYLRREAAAEAAEASLVGHGEIDAAAAADQSAGFDMLRNVIKEANELCKELNCELTDEKGQAMLPTGYRQLVFTNEKVV
jgi:hypothetical protein